MTPANDASRLVEMLVRDASFRERFARDPAGTARALGLVQLAEELERGDGDALQELDRRESRSSLAGAFAAAAAEGVALFELGSHLLGAGNAQAAVLPSSDHAPWNAAEFGAHGTGVGLTPAADALLHDHNVTLDAASISDLTAGRIDPRVVTLMSDIAAHHQIVISSMASDHPEYTTGGSVSNHYYGRAFDIASIDGKPVDADNAVARQLALDLAHVDPSIRPTEIGSPWALPGSEYFTDAEHQNHLHVGYDDPIQPSWQPPADAAGAPAAAAAPAADVAAPSDDSSSDDSSGDPSSADSSADDSSSSDSSSGDASASQQDPVGSDGESGGDSDSDGGSDDDSDAPGEGSNGEDASDDSSDDNSGDDSPSNPSNPSNPSTPPSDSYTSSDSGSSSDSSDSSDTSDGSDGSGSSDSSSAEPVVAPDVVDAPSAYPGDSAPPQAIAAWMAAAAEKRGLPGELPVMAGLVESSLRNLDHGDADSLGFFQMRTSVWDNGAYAGYPQKPELQLQWFLDHAAAVKQQRLAAGLSVTDPKQYGDWIADVERPAAEYRGRYQLRLDEALGLLHSAGASSAPSAGDAQVMPAVDPPTSP